MHTRGGQCSRRRRYLCLSTMMARLNDGDNVITVVLPRICPVRNCQIGNDVKVIPVEEA